MIDVLQWFLEHRGAYLALLLLVSMIFQDWNKIILAIKRWDIAMITVAIFLLLLIFKK